MFTVLVWRPFSIQTFFISIQTLFLSSQVLFRSMIHVLSLELDVLHVAEILNIGVMIVAQVSCELRPSIAT